MKGIWRPQGGRLAPAAARGCSARGCGCRDLGGTLLFSWAPCPSLCSCWGWCSGSDCPFPAGPWAGCQEPVYVPGRAVPAPAQTAGLGWAGPWLMCPQVLGSLSPAWGVHAGPACPPPRPVAVSRECPPVVRKGGVRLGSGCPAPRGVGAPSLLCKARGRTLGMHVGVRAGAADHCKSLGFTLRCCGNRTLTDAWATRGNLGVQRDPGLLEDGLRFPSEQGRSTVALEIKAWRGTTAWSALLVPCPPLLGSKQQQAVAWLCCKPLVYWTRWLQASSPQQRCLTDCGRRVPGAGHQPSLLGPAGSRLPRWR